MPTKKRGRPYKNGAKDARAFLRTLTVLHYHDNARSRGEKYTVAIREAVASVQQLHPGMPISETEVKRILAEFQPKGARTSVVSDYSVVEGEEARKIRSIFSAMDIQPPIKGDPTDTRVEVNSKPLRRFAIGFAKAPNYPRHNQKEREDLGIRPLF